MIISFADTGDQYFYPSPPLPLALRSFVFPTVSWTALLTAIPLFVFR